MMANIDTMKRLSEQLGVAAEQIAAKRNPAKSISPALAELHRFILECKVALDDGSLSHDQELRLWRIFAPTCDWDDAAEDSQLGNEIFSILDELIGAEARNQSGN